MATRKKAAPVPAEKPTAIVDCAQGERRATITGDLALVQIIASSVAYHHADIIFEELGIHAGPDEAAGSIREANAWLKSRGFPTEEI